MHDPYTDYVRATGDGEPLLKVRQRENKIQVTSSHVTSPGLPIGTADSMYGRKGSDPNYSPVKGLTR